MSSAAREAAASPPPIGEALSVGWTTFQANMAPIAIGTLCAMLPGLIPLVGGGWAFAGMMNVATKALRGQAPEPVDGLAGLTQRPMDHLVMGLLQIAGFIACCLGVYVTQALFYPGTLLILERGMTWQQAMDTCMARVKPNLLQWLVFVLVLGLLGGSGALLCIVGVFFTAPIAMIALAYGFEQAFGSAA